MILKAIIDDQVYELNVPDTLLAQARPFFEQLDRDMDQGWQMSREWVTAPDPLQRCRIVADKLLTALEGKNERLGLLMAGYLLSRLPGMESVELDLQGEMQNHRFNLADHPETAAVPTTPVPVPRGGPGGALSKLAALEQAGNQVTKVFKVGKGWRFSVFDQAAGTWQDSPLIATESDASRLRQEAFKGRFEALQRGRGH